MPTLSGNGDTDVYLVTGPVHIHCSGGFGGGTITWKYVGDDGNYKDIANAAFDAPADTTVDFTKGHVNKVKGTLASATGPSVYYEVNAADVRKTT